MKIKCRPEDFRVEELTAFVTSGGPFTLYRLRKKNLGTPEAVDAVARKLRVPRDRISFGGLKDRHAMTSQHLTILEGPHEDIRKPNLQLKYLGQAERAFKSEDIAANHFTLIARELLDNEVADAEGQLSTVEQQGFPNYFDDQRFGSVGKSGQFAAEPWCRGDYERALWLAIADANDNDRPRDGSEKKWLRQRWGDWQRLTRDLSTPYLIAIAERLTERPDDFGRALGCLRHDLRSLLVAAFQSHLWNRILSIWISRQLEPAQCVAIRFRLAELFFYIALGEDKAKEFDALELPLPSARSPVPAGPLQEIGAEVLSTFGMQWSDLEIPFPRDTFFSKGARKATVAPTGLTMRVDADDLYLGKRMATFDFALPRGSYATVLLKRLFPEASRRHVENQEQNRRHR